MQTLSAAANETLVCDEKDPDSLQGEPRMLCRFAKCAKGDFSCHGDYSGVKGNPNPLGGQTMEVWLAMAGVGLDEMVNQTSLDYLVETPCNFSFTRRIQVSGGDHAGERERERERGRESVSCFWVVRVWVVVAGWPWLGG